MKSRTRFFMWITRIVGLFVLIVGMNNPVLAAGVPDLTVVMTHTGDFAQADINRTYTITVTNGGDGDTSGLITLTDTIPTGLIPQEIVGDSGWTCPTGDISALTVLTCTRSTPLLSTASSVITLTVDVAVNAGTGGVIADGGVNYRTVTNTVNVTGGGDLDPSNISNNLTRIAQKPDLVITGYELRNEANTATLSSLTPDQSFWIRMTIQNRGGDGTGSFYPGVFLSGRPNFGMDHDDPSASPVPLILGETTNFSSYRITPSGINNAGCLYYDPSNAINPVNQVVNPERGNYTRSSFIPDIPAYSQSTADVYIGYPAVFPPGNEYAGSVYDSIRNGLSAGTYSVYLYADPQCNAANESYEDNNSYGPITLNIGSFSSGPTDIDVTIAGTSRGVYHLDPGNSKPLQYTLDGGPVVISSNNGVGIIASLNQWRRPTPYGGWTGVAQSMALPIQQISNSYSIPRYDGTDPTLYNAVLMANVDNVPRTITVKIGGVVMGSYDLGPSDSRFEVYNVTGGPLVVSSVTGAKIVASLYELKRAGVSGEYNGQSEMMGLPASQLSDKVLIPIYFGNWGNYLKASIAFANVDTMATTVDVKIAGVSRGTYDMPPSTSMVVQYTLDGGPVEISSNNGAKIVASLNQWRRPTPYGGWTGVAQSLALPMEQISNSYVIPRYNGTDSTLYNAVLMANVDNVPRTITVTIGGVVMGSYNLGPSDSRFEVYNVLGGPVIVSSDMGSKIVASLYELKRAEGAGEYNGQSEMMGLTATQLSDKYLIPIYFGNWGNYLNASLYIGVP